MLNKFILFLILSLLTISCQSLAIIEQRPMNKPSWVTAVNLSGNYFVGISTRSPSELLRQGIYVGEERIARELARKDAMRRVAIYIDTTINYSLVSVESAKDRNSITTFITSNAKVKNLKEEASYTEIVKDRKSGVTSAYVWVRYSISQQDIDEAKADIEKKLQDKLEFDRLLKELQDKQKQEFHKIVDAYGKVDLTKDNYVSQLQQIYSNLMQLDYGFLASGDQKLFDRYLITLENAISNYTNTQDRRNLILSVLAPFKSDMFLYMDELLKKVEEKRKEDIDEFLKTLDKKI